MLFRSEEAPPEDESPSRRAGEESYVAGDALSLPIVVRYSIGTACGKEGQCMKNELIIMAAR